MAQFYVTVTLSGFAVAKKLDTVERQYRTVSSKTDTEELFTDKIIINGKRASLANNPFDRHSSTVIKQISKTLCLCYVLGREPYQISAISLTKRNGKAKPDIFSIAPGDLRQVVTTSTNLSSLSGIDPNKAKIILSETLNGRTVLYAATHLIRSLASSSVHERFDKLWRAFNALYRASEKKPKDHDCHRSLREKIHRKPGNYPLSIAMVSSLTADQIRDNIDLIAMLQNNYTDTGSSDNLYHYVMRNSDHRILQVYKSALSVRGPLLRSERLPESARSSPSATYYDELILHAQKSITNQTVCNSDVLATLCLRYMYYVRNKIIHAERTDHGFTFYAGSSEERKIEWLIPILEAIVIDLINVSDTFPV